MSEHASVRSQEPSGSLQELGSTLLAAPPGPPALPRHRGSFGKCQAAGCPSSERGGGDHNGKRRSGRVLRGQGCSSWGEVTGLHPLSVPRAHVISCSRRFSARCVSWGHFRPGWLRRGQGCLFAPVPWQPVTTDGPTVCGRCQR